MKLLIDTNVILDFALKREPFCEAAIAILDLASECDYIECVSSSAITDIYYTARKVLGNEQTQDSIRNLLVIIDSLSVTKEDILMALDLKWNDFEDAVQYAVAIHNNVDFIISRDDKGFKNSVIPVYKPAEFLELVKDM